MLIVAGHPRRVTAVEMIVAQLAPGVSGLGHGGGVEAWHAVRREFWGRLRRLHVAFFRGLAPRQPVALPPLGVHSSPRQLLRRRLICEFDAGATHGALHDWWRRGVRHGTIVGALHDDPARWRRGVRHDIQEGFYNAYVDDVWFVRPLGVQEDENSQSSYTGVDEWED